MNGLKLAAFFTGAVGITLYGCYKASRFVISTAHGLIFSRQVTVMHCPSDVVGKMPEVSQCESHNSVCDAAMYGQ